MKLKYKNLLFVAALLGLTGCNGDLDIQNPNGFSDDDITEKILNGTDEAKTLQLPMSFVKGKTITLFADGEPWNVTTLKKKPASLECKARGGFVMIIK